MERRDRMQWTFARSSLAFLTLILSMVPSATLAVQNKSAADWLFEAKSIMENKGEENALPALGRACDMALGEACYLQGRIKFGGAGGIYAHRLIIEYRRACVLGWAMACGQAGELMVKASGVDHNPVEVRNLFEKGCEGADAIACRGLAQALLAGFGGASDPERARKAAKRGCTDDARIGDSCGLLGDILYSGRGGPVDMSGAREAFLIACRNWSEVVYCVRSADMLANGQGGAVDLSMARQNFGFACSRKYAPGCEKFGSFIMGKLDKPSNEDKQMAREALAFACQNAELFGCVGAAVMMYTGDGGPVDKDMARRVLALACNGGNVSGCYRLGIMQAQGEGGPSDHGNARVNLTKACEAKLSGACEQLASLH